MLGLFALSPTVRAVDPPPDGGYPGNNTAEGDGALQNVIPDVFNSRGIDNTATGAAALQSNTTGSFNTATGSDALQNNTNGNNNTAHGAFALFSNTGGIYNTATGLEAAP